MQLENHDEHERRSISRGEESGETFASAEFSIYDSIYQFADGKEQLLAEQQTMQ
ncbi:MAG: hypothetical protein ABSA45_01340 [Verrucomicrobiota bacterium]|jgi:hypothetical protein